MRDGSYVEIIYRSVGQIGTSRSQVHRDSRPATTRHTKSCLANKIHFASGRRLHPLPTLAFASHPFPVALFTAHSLHRSIPTTEYCQSNRRQQQTLRTEIRRTSERHAKRCTKPPAAPPTERISNEATSVQSAQPTAEQSSKVVRGIVTQYGSLTPVFDVRSRSRAPRAPAFVRRQAGAMPVLPQIYRRIHDAAASLTAAEDTRIIDARQVEHGIAAVREGAKALVRRIPAAVDRALYGSEEVQKAAALQRRQNALVCDGYTDKFIAGCYQGLDAGPAPGAVVGIVLGSVFGFLLLLWILYTLSNGGGFIQTSNLQEEDVVVRHHGRHRSPRRSSHRSSYREEMRQTNTEAAPAPRRDRVVRQERISRDIPRDVSRSRVRETIIVDESRPERRVDGDDVIEVIAEGSDMTSQAPPPRRKSGRKSSGYRSVQQHRSPSRSPSLSPDPRIESGYRRVDPSRFAGGGFRQHHV